MDRIDQPLTPIDAPGASNSKSSAQPVPPLMLPVHEGLVFTEWTVASFRAWLDRNAFAGWEIYHTDISYSGHIERYLIKHPDGWEPLPSITGGEPLQRLTWDHTGDGDDAQEEGRLRTWPGGALRVTGFDVAIARWYYHSPHDGSTRCFWLIAARSTDDVRAVQKKIEELERSRETPRWIILRNGYFDDETPERKPVPRDSLVLPDALRDRIDGDIVGFFKPGVADLYARLGVPCRRGVMLYGPPGNGKTSTIRYIGGLLPEVTSIILRPEQGFTGDHLEFALDVWKTRAPSMLVLEDLDWILQQVNISTLLNLLDGVDSRSSKPMLLLATTNHPERLDEALTNRPGRFDVVLEVPPPDAAQRRALLASKLELQPGELLDEAVEKTESLSCAHLLEIARLAGLLAINAQRTSRTDEDIRKAIDLTCGTHQNAARGFRPKPAIPFGLQRLAAERSST
jgi:energy-coupling factor transporter ATP-binding protein EcfA2